MPGKVDLVLPFLCYFSKDTQDNPLQEKEIMHLWPFQSYVLGFLSHKKQDCNLEQPVHFTFVTASQYVSVFTV